MESGVPRPHSSSYFSKLVNHISWWLDQCNVYLVQIQPSLFYRQINVIAIPICVHIGIYTASIKFQSEIITVHLPIKANFAFIVCTMFFSHS